MPPAVRHPAHFTSEPAPAAEPPSQDAPDSSSGRHRPAPRRQALLAAAADLFVRWGYDKTSVADIAREAGVSKGAVYLEFPSKDDLFRAVLHLEIAHYMGDWADRFEADPGDGGFASMMRHSLSAIRANPFVRAMLLRDRQLLGSYLRRAPDLTSAAIDVRTGLFEQMQQAGAMRDDIDPAVMAHLMSALMFGIVAGEETIPAARRASFDDVLEALARLLDRGLAAPGRDHCAVAAPMIAAVVARAREATDKAAASLTHPAKPAS